MSLKLSRILIPAFFTISKIDVPGKTQEFLGSHSYYDYSIKI